MPTRPPGIALARRALLGGVAACVATAGPALAAPDQPAPMPQGLGGADPTAPVPPLPIDMPSEAGNAMPVPASGEIAFQLMRHGSRIGTHHLSFAQSGTILRVTIVVEAVVRFLGVPIVRYGHHNLETWDGSRLIGLDATTNRDGEHLAMGATMTKAGLAVHGSRTKPYIAPPNALGTTYWNARMLLGPMIGTQDGQLVHPAVRETGMGNARTAAGQEIACREFTLRGRINSDVAYSLAGAWTSLSFAVADGSLISYQML